MKLSVLPCLDGSITICSRPWSWMMSTSFLCRSGWADPCLRVIICQSQPGKFKSPPRRRWALGIPVALLMEDFFQRRSSMSAIFDASMKRSTTTRITFPWATAWPIAVHILWQLCNIEAVKGFDCSQYSPSSSYFVVVSLWQIFRVSGWWT